MYSSRSRIKLYSLRRSPDLNCAGWPADDSQSWLLDPWLVIDCEMLEQLSQEKGAQNNIHVSDQSRWSGRLGFMGNPRKLTHVPRVVSLNSTLRFVRSNTLSVWVASSGIIPFLER